MSTHSAAGDLARDAILAAQVAAPAEHSLAEVAQRVAQAVSRAEPAANRGAWAERFAARMASGEFLPSVPTLANAGLGGQLGACFVLAPEDSVDSIFETLKRAARIQQGSGGVGIDFSQLRAQGSPIRRSGGVSPGPVAFAELFAHAARVMAMAGRREGAGLAVLRDDHADVLELIRAKGQGRASLPQMGVAVAVSDAFLRAVQSGDAHRFRDEQGREQGAVPARELMDEIVRSIREAGEPTLIFRDRIEEANPVPHLGPLRATNPCGEQPLRPNESCFLGSLQLPAFLDEGGRLDLPRLRRAVGDAVRFLDDVVTVNHHPDRSIRAATLATRKIGLGVMGFADLLLHSGIAYGSRESLKLAAELMEVIRKEARAASERLAAERGAFPAGRNGEPIRRNATLLAVAPTGTLRLLAGCSGGLEPFIAPVVRVVAPEGEVRWVDRWVASWVDRHASRPEEVLEALAEGAHHAEIPHLSRPERFLLRGAEEVPPEDQIAIQAAFQHFVDGAVSKTVHLGEDAPSARIEALIHHAHELGCKGVAFFSRRASAAVSPARGEVGLRRPEAIECGVGCRLLPRGLPGVGSAPEARRAS